MKKRGKNFLILLIIGVQLCLAVPIIRCEEFVCPESYLCLDRDRTNKIMAIMKSEKQARLDLIDCRKEKVQIVETGWKPWAVITISALGILTVGMGSFLVGQELAK